ncbi:MAG: hypothetical protein R3326_00300 [Gemmatimonadota bacterium]|nr:hypothetical protein [Gemmatimonadota bacterium]
MSDRDAPERPPAGGRPHAADSDEGRSPAPASPIACPHCGSVEVEVEAPFGGSLMTRQYWCHGCRTVFEWVRWEPDDDPGGWLDD